MIKYQEYILDNGLTLITHEDKTTPLVVVNLLYKVGSRNEQADKTGFAHLFEHLMFGGSKHVPEFDQVLHKAGAENNAFTNTDITNYYIILNAENLETALWVESDRMQQLTLDQRSLDIQKNVVVEEFKQRYLNVPYGDVWLKLRPLAYQVHPYQWPTIGKEPSHIQEATLDDVQSFYQQHYNPGNAVLTIAGNIDSVKIQELVRKWFGSIPAISNSNGLLPMEPPQTEQRIKDASAKVPMDAIYKVFHMPGRGGKKYIIADLLGDLLGRSKSSRLYQSLVRDKQIFNNINAYITGSADPGLLMISGKINTGKKLTEAEKYIDEEIEMIKQDIKEEEVEKVINQAVSSAYFAETELLNRTISLSVANSLGNTALANQEIYMIRNITKAEILDFANEIFIDENCSTLNYRAKR